MSVTSLKQDEILSAFETYSKIATRKSAVGMDKKSKYYIRKHLIDYLAIVGDDIARLNFISYVMELPQSQSTKYLIANRLGKFLHWMGLLTKEDYTTVRTSFPQRASNWSKKTLTKQQVIEVLNYIDSESRVYYTKYRNLLIIYLLATLGMRISQILEMEINDLWVDKDLLFVRIARKKDIYGKRAEKENKTISISHNIGEFKLENIMNNFLAIRAREKSHYLFCSGRGNLLSYSYFLKLLHTIGRKLNIPNLSPHTFRHFVGTTVTNEHGIVQASILLGHTDIHTTQKYINPEQIDTSGSVPDWRIEHGV